MVEGIADKEETGGFVWFEWQKREFFLALVFQSEAIRKEEEKGGPDPALYRVTRESSPAVRLEFPKDQRSRLSKKFNG